MSVDEENKLLCERLLGWKISAHGLVLAETGGHARYLTMPNFLAGDGMLLLLNRIVELGGFHVMGTDGTEYWCKLAPSPDANCEKGRGDTYPAAVRAAALAYVLTEP